MWINADILPGPRGTATPLDPHVFLQEVAQKSENDVLSLGWTTGWDVDADNPGKNVTTPSWLKFCIYWQSEVSYI